MVRWEVQRQLGLEDAVATTISILPHNWLSLWWHCPSAPIVTIFPREIGFITFGKVIQYTWRILQLHHSSSWLSYSWFFSMKSVSVANESGMMSQQLHPASSWLSKKNFMNSLFIVSWQGNLPYMYSDNLSQDCSSVQLNGDKGPCYFLNDPFCIVVRCRAPSLGHAR